MQADASDTALSAEAVLTPSASAQDEERFRLRHTHPLHYKYKHLIALASYPDIVHDDV